MGWLSKIFGAPKAAAEGVAGAAVKTAEGVANIVERWKPSEAARHEMTLEVEKLVQEASASARAYDPRTVGNSLFSEIVNVTVDAFNRLVRPVGAVLFIGALFGWWDVETQSLDPIIVSASMSILTFYYGVRFVYKDVPTLIRAIREARKA